MEKPICEQCKKDNKEYEVYEGMCSTTLMSITPGYWGKDGKYIQPYNPNRTTCEYSCSNGHSWNVVS